MLKIAGIGLVVLAALQVVLIMLTLVFGFTPTSPLVGPLTLLTVGGGVAIATAFIGGAMIRFHRKGFGFAALGTVIAVVTFCAVLLVSALFVGSPIPPP